MIEHLSILAALGAVEAVVWTMRMRSAVAPGRWVAAAWVALTAALRVGFVAVGASAVMQEVPWWAAVLAYAGAATIAQAAMPDPSRRRG